MKKFFSLPKSILNFVKSVTQELKFVEWLSAKKTANYTAIVLITIVIMGILLALTDQVLRNIVLRIINIET